MNPGMWYERFWKQAFLRAPWETQRFGITPYSYVPPVCKNMGGQLPYPLPLSYINIRKIYIFMKN